ncbi:hypothetical protein J6590_011314 [Homalodisca vitripennis]|nr:hypothetical protein J6590_011314 [Homalodisca vitripennis]
MCSVSSAAGIMFILPCIDQYAKIDIRTAVFDIPPQEASTDSTLHPPPIAPDIFYPPMHRQLCQSRPAHAYVRCAPAGGKLTPRIIILPATARVCRPCLTTHL